MAKNLKAARAAVNAETFGTPAWEAAMQVVRNLTQSINDAAPKFEYTSVDGDIFDRVTARRAT